MGENTDTSRLVAILLAVIGAFVVLPMVFTGFGMMGFGPMMGGTWDSGMASGGAMPQWMFVAGVAVQLLFLAVLVVGGYLAYRAVTGRGDDTSPALEELRLAYARGELTDDEYEQRREALERDSGRR